MTIQLLENRLVKIAKCLVLTEYVEDVTISRRMREEGRVHRQLLLNMLIENCLALASLKSCHA